MCLGPEVEGCLIGRWVYGGDGSEESEVNSRTNILLYLERFSLE